MEPTPLIDLPSALAVELNAHPFALPVRAARGYRPRYLLSELETDIRLPCCPASMAISGTDRGHTKNQLAVHVGILKRLGPGATDGPEDGEGENLTELDALMSLVNQIARWLYPEDNEVAAIETGFGRYIVSSLDNDQAYDLQHLEQQRQFTSVITVSFDLWQGGR